MFACSEQISEKTDGALHPRAPWTRRPWSPREEDGQLFYNLVRVQQSTVIILFRKGSTSRVVSELGRSTVESSCCRCPIY